MAIHKMQLPSSVYNMPKKDIQKPKKEKIKKKPEVRHSKEIKNVNDMRQWLLSFFTSEIVYEKPDALIKKLEKDFNTYPKHRKKLINDYIYKRTPFDFFNQELRDEISTHGSPIRELFIENGLRYMERVLRNCFDSLETNIYDPKDAREDVKYVHGIGRLERVNRNGMMVTTLDLDIANASRFVASVLDDAIKLYIEAEK
ncbi:MAG: hypothetical protein HYW78_02770 [Parcubacteria group bacterium]|nr:hypothetical protein [Parcubacteria group bacterium]